MTTENTTLNKKTTILEQMQTRDVAQWKRLFRNIQQRQQKKLPVDQMVEKLAALEEKSLTKTAAAKISSDKLVLPHELPIAEKEDEIVNLLQNHQVVIVAGETGCGKTTQLPKLCLKAGFGARGLIAHTQPRRVAATSVARRIAEEMSVPLGEEVGYSIRFNHKSSDATRVKLMTDGVLLTELETDPWLSRYEVIIIDEAHERSLNIDFLIGFLRRVITKRSDLKVIITSATIDPEKFSKAFNDAPIVLVEGRSYPVEVRYRPIEQEDSDTNDEPLLIGLQNAVDECYAESTGNILIFADGESQIKTISKTLQKMNLPQTEILPLYARLSITEQQRIFEDIGKRKIIVSTNVAETSLTVPGIIFVIDIGTARISRFSQRNKIQQLPVEKVSRASADQRKGRCGRIAPGICIRLYSEDDYLAREEFTPPEIKRTNLSSVVLKLKAIGVNDVEEFPFIESPTERAWKTAFVSLFELGALDQSDNITDIGKRMARLPVDPQLARILAQPNLHAVDEMLIICSLMSVKEVRLRPHDKQQKADNLHKQYEVDDSDILTAIKLWRTLDSQKASMSSSQFKLWCSKNLINFLGWLEWRRVYFQLKEAVQSEGIQIPNGEIHADEVHSALIPGFITHIFQKTQERYYQGVRGLKVWIHPSSLKFKKGGAWILSVEMIETEKLYARMNCEIKPEWIEKFAGHLVKSLYQEPHWRKNSGQVVAYLSQTLLGLPIVNRRLVNYSQVDEQESRKIFLNEGLAKDNLKADFPFLLANRKKLQAIEETEQKFRASNIRIDAESLSELYDEQLPKHIVSLAGLRKWLKRDFKARNMLLTFSREKLSSKEVEGEEDYPPTLNVKGVELTLKYVFAPGTEQDGVSVIIPQSMISQFTERDFDWLVPGMLEEKVLAAIKSLPKTLRKKLIPLKDTANACTVALNQMDKQKWRFVDALAKVLQRESGQLIKPEDFDFEGLPSHLKMKFELVTGKAKNKQTSFFDVWPTQQVNFVQTQSTKTEKLTSWPEAGFEIERSREQGGIVTREFVGLCDKEDFVVPTPYASLEQAIFHHKLGVSRLLVLGNKTTLNKIFRGWPDKNTMERLCLRNGGFQSLFDAMCLSCAVAMIDLQSLKSAADFINLSNQYKNKIHACVSDRLNQVLPIIKLREKAMSEVAELNEKVFSHSIKDIRNQVDSLWTSGRLARVGEDRYEDYVRYHKGILARIKRIRENYPKEADALEIWEEWCDWWKAIKEAQKQNLKQSQLDSVFWTLEEYRLSLFSPKIKVKGGVSSKKLQKLFEELESLV